MWCNGNTTVFGTVTGGSIPSIPGFTLLYQRNHVYICYISISYIDLISIIIYISSSVFFWCQITKMAEIDHMNHIDCICSRWIYRTCSHELVPNCDYNILCPHIDFVSIYANKLKQITKTTKNNDVSFRCNFGNTYRNFLFYSSCFVWRYHYQFFHRYI